MTPRPRSEELVRRVLERLPRGGTVADVGTGSGAVAVAIAAARPDVIVWATDTSAEAVGLARRNAMLRGVQDRIFVRRGDLLEPVPTGLDMVVANLPYLPLAERPFRLELVGEPPDALFVSGDPLRIVRRLLGTAPAWLASSGVAVVQLPDRVLEVPRGEAWSAALMLGTPSSGGPLAA
jgi:release factor glutamine methyltransferase